VKIRSLFQLFELLEICNVQSSFCDTPQRIAVFLKAQMAGLTTHELKPGDMIKYHMTKKMGCPAFCCLNILEIPSFLLDKIKKNPPVIEHIHEISVIF
jgi:hypothetical protein